MKLVFRGSILIAVRIVIYFCGVIVFPAALKARFRNRALIYYNYLITDYQIIGISVLYGSLFLAVRTATDVCAVFTLTFLKWLYNARLLLFWWQKSKQKTIGAP